MWTMTRKILIPVLLSILCVACQSPPAKTTPPPTANTQDASSQAHPSNSTWQATSSTSKATKTAAKENLTLTSQESAIIEAYMKKNMNDRGPRKGGTNHHAFYYLGKDDHAFYIFHGKTIQDEESKTKATQIMSPAILNYENKGGKIHITDHLYSDDGLEYEKSITEHFPKEASQLILDKESHKKIVDQITSQLDALSKQGN